MEIRNPHRQQFLTVVPGEISCGVVYVDKGCVRIRDEHCVATSIKDSFSPLTLRFDLLFAFLAFGDIRRRADPLDDLAVLYYRYCPRIYPPDGSIGAGNAVF